MNLRDKLKFWIALNNYIEMIVGPAFAPLRLNSAVADSLSYVKAYGGTEQRNLPGEYTQVEYLESSGEQYIDTGVSSSSVNGVKAKISFSSLGDNVDYILGTRPLRSGTALGYIVYTRQHKGLTMYPGVWPEQGKSDVVENNVYSINANIGSLSTLQVDGVEVVSYNTSAIPTGNNSIYIFALHGSGAEYAASAKLYSMHLYNDNELVANYIPCRHNSDDVLGLYDTVSGTFLTNSGTGTFVAGADAVPTPDATMDIVSNNGALKVRHKSGLPLSYTLLEYIQGTGTQYIDTGIVPTLNAKAEVKFMPTQQSQTGYWGARRDPFRFGCVTFSSGSQFGIGMTYNSWPANRTTTSFGTIYDCIVANGYASINGTEYTETAITLYATPTPFRLGAFDASGSVSNIGSARFYKCKLWESNTLVFDGVPAQDSDGLVGIYDLVSGRFFTNASVSYPDDNFVAGPVVNDIEVYADGTVETIKDTIGNTATAEMLLNIGGVVDEQEILGGNITRKVGYVVLDGTENWSAVTNGYSAPVLDASLFNHLICTHFVNGIPTTDLTCSKLAGSANLLIHYDAMTTVSAFKAFLASEYANGTPVIVLYCLENEITESVAGQTLQVTDGDNVLEITQASLSDLQLEAKYKKRV